MHPDKNKAPGATEAFKGKTLSCEHMISALDNSFFFFFFFFFFTGFPNFIQMANAGQQNRSQMAVRNMHLDFESYADLLK